jgi:hypothetical protein
MLGVRDRVQRYVYAGSVLAVVGFVGVRATADYFGPVQDTVAMRYVYPFQLDAASRYINSLPAGTYVYMYSDRWRYDYETRRFLAPDAPGEDRSREYRPGVDDSNVTGALDFTGDRGRDVVFLFLGDYVSSVGEVTQRYPGGTVTEGRRGDELSRATSCRAKASRLRSVGPAVYNRGLRSTQVGVGFEQEGGGGSALYSLV